MAKKIEMFEDFIAWQKARKLTKEIYAVTNVGSFARDFGLKDQIRRSAVSIMSNLPKDLNEGAPQSSISFSQLLKGHAPSCDHNCMSL